mmetsp:Transcript_29171/g.21716  ORF Transcript_29171/g.21716 Transcript_29171/m.21716 type:complete len:91 (+) Transcript_29171:508-780(+)
MNQDYEIKAFGIKSANDCPHRDPDVAHLSVWNEKLEKWMKIFTVMNLKFEKRFQKLCFEVPPFITKKVKIELENKKGHREIQLCQVLLFE